MCEFQKPDYMNDLLYVLSVPCVVVGCLPAAPTPRMSEEPEKGRGLILLQRLIGEKSDSRVPCCISHLRQRISIAFRKVTLVQPTVIAIATVYLSYHPTFTAMYDTPSARAAYTIQGAHPTARFSKPDPSHQRCESISPQWADHALGVVHRQRGTGTLCR